MRLRWVYTDQPFLPLGTHNVITNRIWDADQETDLTVGQLIPALANYRQDERWKLPAVALGAHQCNPQWFAVGEPWPNTLPPTVYYGGWIPACCLEDAMCITDLCAKEPVNGLPASQHTQYVTDAVDATPTTPAAQFVVGEGAAGPGPFIPAVELRGLPQGTSGLAQSVVMSQGVAKLVARRGAVEAAIGVLVDSLGVPQFVLDNVGVPISGLVGGPLPLNQGGTGATTAAAARANLGLGTAAVEDVGASGHTLPFLDAANSWSATQLVHSAAAGNPAILADYTLNNSGEMGAPFQLFTSFGGTPTLGSGIALPMFAQVESAPGVLFHTIDVSLRDTALATRKMRATFWVGGNPPTEYLRGETLASGAGIGFLGAAAVGVQTGDIGAALVAFGLMTGPLDFAGNAATATLAGAATVLQTPRTINGVAFDGSANIEVRLPATNTSGQTVCTAFAITGATGVYQATGNTISIPAAGTYLLTARIRGDLQLSVSAAAYLKVKLRNNTAAADVANSETLVTATAAANEAAFLTAGFSQVVTFAGAATVELYAARVGANFTTSSISSDAEGRTVLDWVRLY